MNNFKIENFCQIHNQEFLTYYNYLNNPIYSKIIFYYISELHTDRMKEYIQNLIKKNHLYVIDKINKIDIILNYYLQNNLINKSEIGRFFIFYEKHRKKINLKSDKDLFTLFYKLILYDNVIKVLKECFYIFSNYRACIYFMSPSINFHNSKKVSISIVKKFVSAFKDNINTLNQIISKYYIGDKTPWGSQYYSSAYAMFDTLMILKKYFDNPLKELDINFVVKKRCNKNNIINTICNNYHKMKFKENDIDNKINSNHINNISHFLFILKRLGYDLLFVIDLVFNSIFEKYILQGVPDSLLFNHHKLYLQKINNLLGVKCYILSSENYISNVNIFQNFND